MKPLQSTMDFVRLKNWSTPVMVLIIIISNLPFIPDNVTTALNAILALISLASTVLIYKYYGSLSAPKTTILTKLMQFCMFSCGLNLIALQLIIPALITFTPEMVQWFLIVAPNLTCSLMLPEPYFTITLYFFFAIQLFKAMAKLEPTAYLNMNHGTVNKITLAIGLVVYLAELTYYVFHYKTLCTKNMIYKIEEFYDMSIKQARSKPPIQMYHFALVWIPHLAVLIVNTFLNTKSIRNKRRVYPVLQTSLAANISSKSPDMAINQKDTKECKLQALYEQNNRIADKAYERINLIFKKRMIQVAPSKETSLNTILNVEKAIDIDEMCVDGKEKSSTPRASNNLEIENKVKVDKFGAETYPPNMSSLKPQVLKMDLIFFLGTIGSILLLASIIMTGQSYGMQYMVFWFIDLIGIIVTIVLPPYWIQRSDEITNFSQRRLMMLF